MKKSLLKLIAIALITGFISSCSEEEITPNEQLNAKKTGVERTDGGF